MTNQEKERQVQMLRAEARFFRDKNNELVNQVWRIEHALTTLTKPEDRETLLKQKAAIEAQIEKEKLEPEFRKKLEEIKVLERELYGRTDLDSNSPYVL